MITTIDTVKIGNLVIMTGDIILIPANVKPCGERNEHIDFIMKSGGLEMQVVCRGEVGREVIAMQLRKGNTVSVIGYLENDGDTIIIADSVVKL